MFINVLIPSPAIPFVSISSCVLRSNRLEYINAIAVPWALQRTSVQHLFSSVGAKPPETVATLRI